MFNSKWGIIATWRMAFDGINNARKKLEDSGMASDAVIQAIKEVEDYPFYKSVGYGGLPNEEGVVELDAAYMDGTNLAIGAVAGIQNLANPILIAKALSEEKFNNFLVGQGAEKWAQRKGFETKNMLTERASQHYKKRCEETIVLGLSPYIGHDTVGIAALDMQQNICVGTSTSGLFMKRAGRVGDSPLSGSGFYADSLVGAATCTGLGEDLMKGCLSYEVVRRMKNGMSPQLAAESALYELEDMLNERYERVGDLSVVCIDKNGEFGAATNIENFTFSVATYKHEPTIYLCENLGNKTIYEKVSNEWLSNYEKKIKQPIE